MLNHHRRRISVEVPAREPLIRFLHNALTIASIVAGVFLTGCGESVSEGEPDSATRAAMPRILAMGDSMLAWNRSSGMAVSDELERELNTQVVDRSVIAARYNYALPISGAMGLNISKQYRANDWDWVVLNGGGNDLWFGCGCVACDHTIDKLITSSARKGKIPDLVREVRNDGAKVIFVSYLHSPGTFSIIDHCKDDATDLESRLAKLESIQDGFYYLNLANLVPSGDRSFHSADMVHPSKSGSRRIGKLIAQLIRSKSPL